MAKLTGKQLYLEYGGVNISGTQRTFSYTHEQEQADLTAGQDEYRNFGNTVKMIEAEAEVLVREHADGGSALFAGLALGGQGTLIWGPEGTATGKPKFGFLANLVDTSAELPFDDAYVLTLKFAMAGTALAFNGVTSLF